MRASLAELLAVVLQGGSWPRGQAKVVVLVSAARVASATSQIVSSQVALAWPSHPAVTTAAGLLGNCQEGHVEAEAGLNACCCPACCQLAPLAV